MIKTDFGIWFISRNKSRVKSSKTSCDTDMINQGKQWKKGTIKKQQVSFLEFQNVLDEKRIWPNDWEIPMVKTISIGIATCILKIVG